MNGYDLSRQWFDFAFEKSECKVQHTALYFWIIELNNRLGWKKQFGLPTAASMEGLSIGDKRTFLSALKDLQEWGFIRIIQEAKNQFQSCIIEMSHSEITAAQTTALDTAMIRQNDSSNIDTATGKLTSGTPIDKQRNKETKKPKQARVREEFDPLSESLPYPGDPFREAWTTWCDHRFSKGKNITPQAFKLQMKKLIATGSEPQAIKMIEKAIEHNWEGLYDLNERDIADLEKPAHTTIAQKYTNKNSWV